MVGISPEHLLDEVADHVEWQISVVLDLEAGVDRDDFRTDTHLPIDQCVSKDDVASSGPQIGKPPRSIGWVAQDDHVVIAAVDEGNRFVIPAARANASWDHSARDAEVEPIGLDSGVPPGELVGQDGV